MYSILIRKYEGQKKEHEKEQEKLRGQIKEEFDLITKRNLQIHNRKVIQIHQNQQKIQAKNKAVALHYGTAGRALDKWVELYNGLNEALKAAGDLVNYSTFIDNELEALKAPQEPEESKTGSEQQS